MKSIRHSLTVWIMAFVLAIAITASLASIALCADVSQDQKDRLKNLATETRQKARSERENLMRARMELFDAYRNYDLNERKAKAAIDKIDQSQLNLLNIHLDNQIGIRSILNASQFAQFKEMIDTRMRGRGMRAMAPMDDDADAFAEKALLDGIDMSADQRRKVASQVSGLTRKKMNMTRKLQRNSKQMMDIYADYNLDTAAAKKLIAGIHRQQSDLLDLNFKKQQALRAVLTESQFNTLMDQIASRMKERMGNRRDRWKD